MWTSESLRMESYNIVFVWRLGGVWLCQVECYEVCECVVRCLCVQVLCRGGQCGCVW